jgi:hypothetical protein
VIQKEVLKHSRVLFQPFDDRRRDSREGRVGRREERCGRRQLSEELSSVNVVLQGGDVMTFLDENSLMKILLRFFACRMEAKLRYPSSPKDRNGGYMLRRHVYISHLSSGMLWREVI